MKKKDKIDSIFLFTIIFNDDNKNNKYDLQMSFSKENQLFIRISILTNDIGPFIDKKYYK